MIWAIDPNFNRRVVLYWCLWILELYIICDCNYFYPWPHSIILVWFKLFNISTFRVVLSFEIPELYFQNDSAFDFMAIDFVSLLNTVERLVFRIWHLVPVEPLIKPKFSPRLKNISSFFRIMFLSPVVVREGQIKPNRGGRSKRWSHSFKN